MTGNLAFEQASDYLRELLSRLPKQFLEGSIPADPAGRYSRKVCIVSGCIRISKRTNVDLCRPHGEDFSRTLRESPGLEVEAWAASVSGPVRNHRDGRSTLGHFDVALAQNEVLQMELAYGLYRRGQRDVATKPEVLNRLARELAKNPCRSIVELRYNRIAICDLTAACGGYSDTAQAFLLDALDELCELQGVEPTRRHLGMGSGGGSAFVNLNQIENEEFRASILR